MWSVAKRVFVLIPTSNGEPLRVATHSSGKCFDLKASAKAPSCNAMQLISLCVGSMEVNLPFVYQLLNDLLDQLPERVARVLFVQVVDELCDHFGVCLRLEVVSLRLQKPLDVLVVGDDAVVDDDKRVVAVGSLWMRVRLARRAVSRPARVRDADVRLQLNVAGRVRI